MNLYFRAIELLALSVGAALFLVTEAVKAPLVVPLSAGFFVLGAALVARTRANQGDPVRHVGLLVLLGLVTWLVLQGLQQDDWVVSALSKWSTSVIAVYSVLVGQHANFGG